MSTGEQLTKRGVMKTSVLLFGILFGIAVGTPAQQSATPEVPSKNRRELP